MDFVEGLAHELESLLEAEHLRAVEQYAEDLQDFDSQPGLFTILETKWSPVSSKGLTTSVFQQPGDRT
jgi:hypothetical protein